MWLQWALTVVAPLLVRLETCKDSLAGAYIAKTASRTGDLSLNGTHSRLQWTYNGQILAHIHGTEPVPTTRIRRTGDTFGTVLTGARPVATNRYGWSRVSTCGCTAAFVYRGSPHSYLSAACATPCRFSFARASIPSLTAARSRALSRAAAVIR